jgi:hypothetical protein
LEDGTTIVDHEHKAAIMWNSFKDRLGQSESDLMLFDLSTLIQLVQLCVLDKEFSCNEIDGLISDLPLDKALGPDGFNGMFIKRCWPIIKADFYALFEAFYQEQINLQCLKKLFHHTGAKNSKSCKCKRL